MTESVTETVERRRYDNMEVHQIRNEVRQLISDVSDLKANYASVVSTVQLTSEEVRGLRRDLSVRNQKSLVPVIAVAITGLTLVISILVTLGTLTINPVIARQHDTDDKVEKHVSEFYGHTDDGHPETVKELINTLDAIHTRERKRLQEQIHHLHNIVTSNEKRMDSISTELAVLDTVAEERTERFKATITDLEEKLDLKSQKRWDSDRQRVYAAGVERRLKILEREETK